mmetsp:Transcript_632/g.614  ORF Transcript_632/g.614 Transcript_632/m.614 type:complete len:224 (+) Transcript_632:258-929(+)
MGQSGDTTNKRQNSFMSGTADKGKLLPPNCTRYESSSQDDSSGHEEGIRYPAMNEESSLLAQSKISYENSGNSVAEGSFEREKNLLKNTIRIPNRHENDDTGLENRIVLKKNRYDSTSRIEIITFFVGSIGYNFSITMFTFFYICIRSWKFRDCRISCCINRFLDDKYDMLRYCSKYCGSRYLMPSSFWCEKVSSCWNLCSKMCCHELCYYVTHIIYLVILRI